MKETLDKFTTIVPGHGPIDHGAEPIDGLAVAGIPAETRAGLQRLNREMDRLNVLSTYREFERAGIEHER
jgi:hypothetical protein